MITQSRKGWISAWFAHHCRSLLRKQFRRLSLTAGSELPVFEPGVPAVVISNHSSWWDPIVGFYLSAFWFKRPAYGVMAEEQLRRYGIFRHLGVYSVDRNGTTGDAREFLLYSQKLVEGLPRLLWIYPQGEIVSSESLPLKFKDGFARILARLPRAHLLQLVASYDFWIERAPEIVLDIAPVRTLVPQKGAAFVDETLRRAEAEMTGRLADLRRIVRERDASGLRPLFTEEAGTHPVYDFWRNLRARARREAFAKHHGAS
jgi:1-acyl-sn-glycerol-3-phosphate acyltransferase